MIKNKLSVVVPVYHGEKSLPELYSRIKKNAEEKFSSYEIILVNDSSPDNSWEVIKNICEENTKVKGINLTRNFGQHYAILAGLKHVQGEWIVVMDCDLQDMPEEIGNLYKQAMIGYDIVIAQRTQRKDIFRRKVYSKLFYLIFGWLTETSQDSSTANFGIYHNRVISSVLSMKDHIWCFSLMIQWVGFKKCFLPVNHDRRLEGKSSYTLKKLLSLSFNNMIGFSDKSLYLVTYLGLIISFFSVLVSIYYLIAYFMGIVEVSGYISLILSIWFLGGSIIFILGITGIYIGKVFDKVKERPLYIISDSINID